jgi:hypothetical protein
MKRVQVRYCPETETFEITLPVEGSPVPLRVRIDCYDTIALAKELRREVDAKIAKAFGVAQRHLSIVKGGHGQD